MDQKTMNTKCDNMPIFSIFMINCHPAVISNIMLTLHKMNAIIEELLKEWFRMLRIAKRLQMLKYKQIYLRRHKKM